MAAFSCIYEGHVLHRRHSPKPHAFRFPLFMVYLDLAELPRALDGNPGCSARRPALAWFRRADYLGPDEIELDEAVRRQVRQSFGDRPAGPIRMLTHLRTFGYVFNPVTFYYVFDPAGEQVEYVVAEITNTPWGERHTYVVRPRREREHHLSKHFHVSPFLPMDMHYRWTFSTPGTSLEVHMENWQHDNKVFEADLVLRRNPLRAGTLTLRLLRYPLMTAQVMTAIHFQALRLWLKRVPFYPHPAKAHRSAT